MKRPFVSTPRTEESYYDICEDWGLVESSFAQQYGIRLRTEEDMVWSEFVNLLAGLNGDTPLGRVVSIRSESDPKRIKEFAPSERRIRNEWAMRKRNVVSDKKEYDTAINGFLQMFKALGKQDRKGG